MKKSTLAATGGAGVASLALLAAMAHADGTNHSDVANLELDMQSASMVALEATAGQILDIEIEMEDDKAIWEVDIVNDANQLVTVEIDGATGSILSTSIDDDEDAVVQVDALDLSKAIGIIQAVEQGAMVEAELENEYGQLVWEIESINADNSENEIRIDARTGEILI